MAIFEHKNNYRIRLEINDTQNVRTDGAQHYTVRIVSTNVVIFGLFIFYSQHSLGKSLEKHFLKIR